MKSFNRLYLKFKHKSISSLFFYISSFICSNISSNKSIRIRGEPTNCHPETFVVSSGFGQTAEEAARVASVEVRSYGVDPSKFKLSIEPIQIDGSKVLDFRDPKTRDFFNNRIDLNMLIVNRRENLSYNLPNMLGHSAHSNGIESIILKSVPDKEFNSGYNFHTLGIYGN